MNLKRLATLLILMVGLIIGQASVYAAGNTFTFRMSGEPETLDWNRAHTMVETYLLMNLMEGLVSFDTSLSVQPALAKSWDVSPDGLTYAFHLRPGVKWSDGVPLKAGDFVFSWKRLLSPITAAPYAYLLFDVVGAEDFYKTKISDFSQVGVHAPDDLTLIVKLRSPNPRWIYIPTFWVTFPLRADVVAKNGNSWETPGRMVTLGPYTLAAHDVDTKVELRANPNYYGTRGNIDVIDGIIVQDDSTALTLYESGRLDFLTDISTIDLKRLAGRADLHRFPYLKTGYLGFVSDKFPLSDVHVRKAIAMAIDRNQLGAILHGGQEAAHSFVPPKMMGHSDSIGLPYDPVAARREIRKSSLDPGTALTFDLLLPNWDKQLMMGQFIQQELKKNLSAIVNLQPFDHKTFRAQLDLHAYPLFEGSWSADFPDPDNFLSIFLSDSGNNRFGWKSAALDAEIARARGLSNETERRKIYEKAQKTLQEDEAVLMPLYYEPILALVRPRIKGLEINPLNYLELKNVRISE